MFVGHYAASFALKPVAGRLSLGWLFLAAQFVDILFFPLSLLGIEKFNFVENYTASTHFELVFMPYTHSLVASFIWAGLVFFAAKRIFRNATNATRIGLVAALVVVSHWFLDFLVHTPDLPLFSDASTKLGLGLWNYPIVAYLLEAGLLLGALFIYLRATQPVSRAGRYGIILFAIALLIINAINSFAEPIAKDEITLSIIALLFYLSFAGVAFWLDGKRIPKAAGSSDG